MKNASAVLVAVVFAIATAFAGCTARNQAPEDQAGADQMTVGTVQKEIRKGMPASDVAAALGSPNIVTTDENGLEVWIYDKVATDRVETESGSGVWLLIFGAGTSTRSSSTGQRTLTVIIKYDDQKKVRDFAYHSSRF